MKEKFLTKGNISLFIITAAVVILVAIVCRLCGAERTTVLFSAQSSGILAMLVIGALFKIADLKSPMGPEAGILAVVFGTIFSMIIF